MTTKNPIIISEEDDTSVTASSSLLNSSARINANLIAAEVVSQPKPGKRLNVKNWFLTFPQTNTTKEQALAKLRNHPKLNQLGIKGIMIAQEYHQGESVFQTPV